MSRGFLLHGAVDTSGRKEVSGVSMSRQKVTAIYWTLYVGTYGRTKSRDKVKLSSKWDWWSDEAAG